MSENDETVEDPAISLGWTGKMPADGEDAMKVGDSAAASGDAGESSKADENATQTEKNSTEDPLTDSGEVEVPPSENPPEDTQNSENDSPNSAHAKSQTANQPRVKLYVLNDERNWDDKGTGHVTFERLMVKFQGPGLRVISEAENRAILLESAISRIAPYQKQQETLIVWSESDSTDLALSFQEKVGCDAIWEQICLVQGKDPSVTCTQEGSFDSDDDMNNSTSPNSLSGGNSCTPNSNSGAFSHHASAASLPPAEIGRLPDLLDHLMASNTHAAKRDQVAVFLEVNGYVPKLLELFRKCEQDKNTESLRFLYNIFKTVLMLNKNALLEVLFSDDHIKDVIGVFEYEPSETALTPRPHRDFLWRTAALKEVVPIENKELRGKIHQTYRLQYIQDVILPAPSIFEENNLSSLASYIFFNRVEIVNMIQEDGQLLPALFGHLKSCRNDPGAMNDAILFLKEFCTFAQALQQSGNNSRETFFRTLTSHSVLPALEQCLSTGRRKARAAAVEILAMIVDNNAASVREYILQQGKNDQLLINILLDQVRRDTDPELSSGMQVLSVLRLLLDPDNMMAAAPGRPDKNEFLGFFYKRAMSRLCAPLLCTGPAGKNLLTGSVKKGEPPSDYRSAHRLSLIVDMVCFCIEHHTYHVRAFILHKKVLSQVLQLLRSRHAFLALGALRLVRRVVALKDDFWNRHLIKFRLLEPLVTAYHANGHRYNLLNSALLEFFEFILTDDIKLLLVHFCENYLDQFTEVNYVRTFKQLAKKFEMYKERQRDIQARYASQTSASENGATAAGGEKSLGANDTVENETDERWFNDDEDEEWEEDLTSKVPAAPSPLSGNSDDRTSGSFEGDSDAAVLVDSQRVDDALSKLLISVVKRKKDSEEDEEDPNSPFVGTAASRRLASSAKKSDAKIKIMLNQQSNSGKVPSGGVEEQCPDSTTDEVITRADGEMDGESGSKEVVLRTPARLGGLALVADYNDSSSDEDDDSNPSNADENNGGTKSVTPRKKRRVSSGSNNSNDGGAESPDSSTCHEIVDHTPPDAKKAKVASPEVDDKKVLSPDAACDKS